MFKKILVPLDGSKLAEGILPQVEQLAKIHGSEVTLLRVALEHIFEGTDPIEYQVKMVREAENYLAKDYYEKSRPIFCAKEGFVDEVVSFAEMRKYMVAFAGCVYQNPLSICPHHHMMLPRLIKG